MSSQKEWGAGQTDYLENRIPFRKRRYCFVLKKGLPIFRLKVLTNEKRGGLKVVAFDKSPFKLFTLRIFKQIGVGPIL
jgi:hypothetical protein